MSQRDADESAAPLGQKIIFFVENGANIELADANGATALMFASKARWPDVVQYLLLMGARTDRTDDEGRTAIELAIEKGNAEIVDILLNAFAEPEINPQNGHDELI
uniref:ANK_REP_REGION domain-containing protein n=1 Tax=Globodera pallida TaxID=36090 RepID=A0A183CKG4_GLOPA